MKRYKIILGAAGFLFILGLVGTEAGRFFFFATTDYYRA